MQAEGLAVEENGLKRETKEYLKIEDGLGDAAKAIAVVDQDAQVMADTGRERRTGNALRVMFMELDVWLRRELNMVSSVHFGPVFRPQDFGPIMNFPTCSYEYSEYSS